MWTGVQTMNGNATQDTHVMPHLIPCFVVWINPQQSDQFSIYLSKSNNKLIADINRNQSDFFYILGPLNENTPGLVWSSAPLLSEYFLICIFVPRAKKRFI